MTNFTPSLLVSSTEYEEIITLIREKATEIEGYWPMDDHPHAILLHHLASSMDTVKPGGVFHLERKA